LDLGKQISQHARAAATPRAFERAPGRAQVEDAQQEGLLECSPKPPLRHGPGEVDKGAGDGGARDDLANGHFVVW